MMLPKPTTERDSAYRAWIATLPCLECGTTRGVCAHHTATGGTGTKGSDYSCVPLCFEHHAEWHDKLGKRGPYLSDQLELILEQLQHNYLVSIKKGE